MPVPLAPYPTPPAPYTPPANGAQSQLVCSGCRNLLLYPVGATSVCCAVCNAVTAVPPPGTEMAQLVCGGCHTLLMYIRGATSVQCSCCHTVNLALEANQVAHVNCGNCRMLLMYQYGARSVKCAVCNFVTSVGVSLNKRYRTEVQWLKLAERQVDQFCILQYIPHPQKIAGFRKHMYRVVLFPLRDILEIE
ncbi:hypothetical protein EZV62_019577 [Acer yangbiense]|uniref:Zinc finger LSD1-type domain-containing protein n=1 Tax=Acer yangbiense TaxID=1000413 RepID=A0A5C7HBP8_9ROSI|nr:hypothetical protein EZV62_019577 [Acer yangbiense]